MNIDELVKQEKAYLNANNSMLREFGIAYRDIIKSTEMDADPMCSEEMLLDKHAREMFKKYEFSLKLTKEEKYKYRMKAASDLMIKALSLAETTQLLQSVRARDFDSVNKAIKDSPKYKWIDPRVLIAALKLAERNDLGVV